MPVQGRKRMRCIKACVEFVLAASAATFLATEPSSAQSKYDAGASDSEVKIGNIMPYSGPASSYGVMGKVYEAYFAMINDQGGIGGRKIKLISYDDGYSPPKAVEQTRKLVERDEVLVMFSAMGTASNIATQKYLNTKRVPQLFVASGASRWGDPKAFPWSMGWLPPYQSEGRIFARYLLKEKPDAKIAVLYQGDDLGKDYLRGLKDGLGAKASSMIVAETSYEVSEPTIDSHIVNLKAAGADTLVAFTTPKFAAQAIRKANETRWNPLLIVPNISASINAVMKPAGFENAQGVITAAFAKEITDPQWDSDEGMKKYRAFLEKYGPGFNKSDIFIAYAYGYAQTMAQVLKQSGNDLTRENVMKQAANLKNFSPDILLPGITINTGSTDFYPLEQLKLMRFRGEKWELFGEIIDSEIGK